jgi:hypothetical protein
MLSRAGGMSRNAIWPSGMRFELLEAAMIDMPPSYKS